jgi:hypothetical protein
MAAIAAKPRVRMAKTRDDRVTEEFPDLFIAPIEHDIVALSRPISVFRALSDRSLQAASASAGRKGDAKAIKLLALDDPDLAPLLGQTE